MAGVDNLVFLAYSATVMRVLAIETSCDETSAAIIAGDWVVGAGHAEPVRPLAHVVRSQIVTHQAFGGVVPEVAAREHLAYMVPMVAKVMADAGVDKDGIDAIAVTVGPGLAPALRVGVEVAKTLAVAWGKPLVPVCHLEGHIYASWLGQAAPEFPVLAVIVSGGHTELVLMKNHGEFERIGETIDDAAGEAFDKVAKMLGLPYPGGPAVEKLAVGGDEKAFAFPRAMPESLDFSFSGVKTSVLYTLRENEEKMGDEAFRRNIAASFQEAVVDVLVKKAAKAVAKYRPASVVLAGGVAANVVLRTRLQEMGERLGVAVHVPPFAYSLDNAAMIGAAGCFRFALGHTADPLTVQAQPNMDIA